MLYELSPPSKNSSFEIIEQNSEGGNIERCKNAGLNKLVYFGKLKEEKENTGMLESTDFEDTEGLSGLCQLWGGRGDVIFVSVFTSIKEQ